MIIRNALCISVVLDNVVFSHIRAGEGDTNRRILRETHQRQHGFHTAGDEVGCPRLSRKPFVARGT